MFPGKNVRTCLKVAAPEKGLRFHRESIRAPPVQGPNSPPPLWNLGSHVSSGSGCAATGVSRGCFFGVRFPIGNSGNSRLIIHCGPRSRVSLARSLNGVLLGACGRTPAGFALACDRMRGRGGPGKGTAGRRREGCSHLDAQSSIANCQPGCIFPALATSSCIAAVRYAAHIWDLKFLNGHLRRFRWRSPIASPTSPSDANVSFRVGFARRWRAPRVGWCPVDCPYASMLEREVKRGFTFQVREL